MALKGINLGGWLVAERWMAPGLFDGVRKDGERAIGRELSALEATKRLKAHRDTFITEKDFIWIKDNGFDFVRLPVGYWLFEDSEGYIPGEAYVKKVFSWAMKHQLGVVLDFHGLQGSQNGQDHSGETGKVRWYRRRNSRGVLQTMEYLAKTYGHEPALIGLEVINEPKVRWLLWPLLRYYDKAIAIAQHYVRSDVKIIVSDAFKPLRVAKALAKRDYGEQVTLDLHLYGVFSRRDRSMTYDEHLQKAGVEWSRLIERLRTYVPHVYVGEWSGALPPSAYKPDVETKEKVRAYMTAQEVAFDQAWAHTYWSYKTPGMGAWDYRSLVANRLK